jgi:HK97 gp10 family phage protein
MSDIEGFEEWSRRVLAMPQAVYDASKAAVQQNADEFAEKLRAVCPEKTGGLVNTITQKAGTGATPTAGDKELTVTVSIGDAQHEVAGVEFGHMDKGKHVPAHPFFYPTLRVFRKKANRRVSNAMRKAIKALCVEATQDGDE